MIPEEYMLIIDGSSLLSTQYYGNMPRDVLMARSEEERAALYHKLMHTKSGVYTNGVYGFLRSLFKILETMPPAYLCVTWDLTRDTFRRELYPDYKANRSETPAPLKEQFALCQKVLSEIGVAQFMDMRYEADDFSGSLCEKFKNEVPIRILTKDHDYLQLVDDRVNVFLLQSAQTKADELLKKHGIAKTDCPEKCFLMTPETVLKEEGVKPASIAHLKALMGDSSDNIKGVPGIGKETAVSLIACYETVDRLYEALHSDEAAFLEKTKSLGIRRSPVSYLLKEDAESICGEKAARLSLKLATIKTDIPIPESLPELALSLNGNGVDQVLHELEFDSLKAPEIGNVKRSGKEFSFRRETVRGFDEAEALFGRLLKAEGLSYGFSFTQEGTVYLAGADTVYEFIPDGFFLNSAVLSEYLRSLSKANAIYSFGLKKAFEYFPEAYGNVYDLSVMDYLLRPLTAAHEPKDLHQEYLLEYIFSDDPAFLSYAARALGSIVKKKLIETEMLSLYEKIEHPLIFVLSEMERTGIYADPTLLAELDSHFSSIMRKEEQTVYELAGTSFNLNSPKQLGEVLFEKLKIPGGKKTKTGYSTAADELEKLAENYPIVSHILTYRQYMKLQSTYAAGLAGCIAKDGRIHTTFQQTVTATGRLSSTEPNLQNIPIRTEAGREIRKVFLPADGMIFLDADYSQIELRLMAHMSGDPALIAAYNNAEDIHRLTASQVFHVPFEEVTSEQRSAAKAVNFGILYGISSFGLGQNLGIDRKTAEAYIEAYYERYPAMKAYLTENVRLAKEKGFVRTMFGRIRPIPELESGNFVQRSFGERVAMNSPIQGTAADIMKLAMIRVHDALAKKGLKSRMLVQVHDEILLEVPLSEADEARDLVKEAMEGAAKLSVPLVADIHTGRSWYEAK